MTSVLQLLRASDSPSRAILRLLPGSGDRHDLATFVAESALRGPVVVLAKTRLELDQWYARLQPLMSSPPIRLTSADDALQLDESHVLSGPVAILSTFPGARRGPLANLIRGMEIELLVVDGPPPLDIASHEEGTVIGLTTALLSERARRTVVVVTGTTPYFWEGAVALREVTEDDFSRATSGVEVVDVSFLPTPSEVDVQSRARSLLEAHSPQLGDRALPLASNYELHEQLLSILTQSGEAKTITHESDGQSRLAPDEEEAAWAVLDALENLHDSKLAALDSVLSQPSDEGRSWLITSKAIRDVNYIADHLRSVGNHEVSVLTSLTEPSHRESALRFGPGQVLVAGRLVYDLLNQWPPNCNAVWWTPPGSRTELEHRLDVLTTGGNVRVYQLIPQGDAPGTN